MTRTVTDDDRTDLRAGRRVIYLHGRRHVFPPRTSGPLMEAVAGLVDQALAATIGDREVSDVTVGRVGTKTLWKAVCIDADGCPMAQSMRVRPVRSQPPREHVFDHRRDLIAFMGRYRDAHEPQWVEQPTVVGVSATLWQRELRLLLPGDVERGLSGYPRAVAPDVKVVTWREDVVAATAMAALEHRGRLNGETPLPDDLVDGIRRTLKVFRVGG